MLSKQEKRYIWVVLAIGGLLILASLIPSISGVIR